MTLKDGKKREETNLGWEHLTEFATMDFTNLPLRSEIFKLLWTTFNSNIDRIRGITHVTRQLCELSALIQKCNDIAISSVNGGLSFEDVWKSYKSDEITTKTMEIWDRVLTKGEINGDGSFVDAVNSGFVSQYFDDRHHAAAFFSGVDARARKGFDAVFSTAIINVWAAFESLSGDLWELAVNEHPLGLSELSGKKNRMFKGKTFEDTLYNGRQEDTDKKFVQLSLLQKYGFNCSKKMGSLLRHNRRFDSLSGIRESYALAFSRDYEKLDECLSETVLDVVNMFRNVLVHRGGVMDEVFVKKSKAFKLEMGKIGGDVVLNGRITKSFLLGMINVSGNLVLRVEDWIMQH
jgi:hypothetical protein